MATDKLFGMLAFARVAEYGGFTPAAARLGMTVSAVAKAVARLEDELGAQLLTRTTRKVSLNDSGREFYARCTRILNEVEEAEEFLRRDQQVPRGRVRLTMPVSFGRVTFLPSVAEFALRYPEIKLELVFRDGIANIAGEGSDLTVYVGELKDSSLQSRQLNYASQVCAASPAYLERHGMPRTPQDLLKHNCIAHYPGPVWRFRSGHRRVDVCVDGNIIVNTGDHLREAALLGLGIVQTNWWTLRHDLTAHTLVALLEEYAMEGRPISVIFQKSRPLPMRLRVTIDFLVEITRLAEPN